MVHIPEELIVDQGELLGGLLGVEIEELVVTDSHVPRQISARPLLANSSIAIVGAVFLLALRIVLSALIVLVVRCTCMRIRSCRSACMRVYRVRWCVSCVCGGVH